MRVSDLGARIPPHPPPPPPPLPTLTRVPPAPQIILRKGYHLLAAALFLPAFFLDLPMLCASLAVALAALVAAEALRCNAMPWLGPRVQSFMEVGRLGLWARWPRCRKWWSGCCL